MSDENLEIGNIYGTAAPAAHYEPPVAAPEATQVGAVSVEVNSKDPQVDPHAAARDIAARYPEVAQAMQELITSHSNNPEHLKALVTELADQMEAARVNPGSNAPVNPAIREAVEKIRAAEIEKQKEAQKVAEMLVGGLAALAGGAALVETAAVAPLAVTAAAPTIAMAAEPVKYVLEDHERPMENGRLMPTGAILEAMGGAFSPDNSPSNGQLRGKDMILRA